MPNPKPYLILTVVLLAIAVIDTTGQILDLWH